MADFLKAVYDYNICTYYVLPLIKLNKNSFGPKNFRQCYINQSGTKLYVKVGYTPMRIDQDPDYLATVKHQNVIYLVFSIPPKWYSDIQLFIEGKYSKMSPDARDMIKLYGGMAYKLLDQKTGKPFTDARLMAIDDDLKLREQLRRVLEGEFGTDIPPGQELISIPSSQNFIDGLIQEQTANAFTPV